MVSFERGLPRLPGQNCTPVYILVFRGEVSIDLVDDFFSGPIVVSWRKLQCYFFDERRETGRETVGEWFQWLAERFAEREGAAPPVPANVQYRDWRPH